MAVYLTDRMGGVPSTFAALARTVTAVHQVVIFLTIRQVRSVPAVGIPSIGPCLAPVADSELSGVLDAAVRAASRKLQKPWIWAE